MTKSFEDIDLRIQQIGSMKPKKLSVAAAAEDHVIQAVCTARDKGIAEAVLVGNERKIKTIAKENHYDLHGLEIIDVDDTHEAAKTAVSLVKTGEAQMLMKGLLDSSVYLKAILDKENGIRGNTLLSYISVFELAGRDELLIVTDAAINIAPNCEDKEQIMKNAILLASALGGDCPKIAFLSPVEKINPKIESTVHAAEIKEKYKDCTNFVVDGPFALDIAVSKEAASIKGINSAVAGGANILIASDLGMGNVLYKSLIHFAKSQNGSVVLGARAPVIMTSRSDSVETKLNSIKLGVLLSETLYI